MPVSIKEYKKEAKVVVAPVKSGAKQESIFTKDIKLFGGSIGMKFREQFYSELGVLLYSGLDIQTAFKLIGESQRKPVHKELIDALLGGIMEGHSLSESMQRSEKFSDYEVFSIQIGEESGKLLQVLEELSLFYEKSIKYRQQLVGALAYPGFVIGFAFLVVFFLLKFLVPMFADIYARFDGDLPAVTQFIITCSDWMGKNIYYLVLGIGTLIAAIYTQRKKDAVRNIGAKMLLAMPIFGGIYRQIFLARFAQAMYFLLGANVPLLKTVGLVKQMVGFYPIEQALMQAEQDILAGEMLNKTLNKSGFFPSRLIALLKVGEEASNLDEMFKKVANEYNKEVERKTATIGSLIEPVLIVCLGGLVGFILVAMYLPLFQLSVGVGN